MDTKKFEKFGKFEKFKEIELKTNEMSTIKGGSSTTLFTTVGYAENEYEDTNGNGELDEGDRFSHIFYTGN